MYGVLCASCWRGLLAWFERRALVVGALLALLALLAGCAVDGDDQADAEVLEVDAGADAVALDASADAAPCGETWGRCCANDAPEGRCNPEAICNIAEVCEPMCFPYCSDGGAP